MFFPDGTGSRLFDYSNDLHKHTQSLNVTRFVDNPLDKQNTKFYIVCIDFAAHNLCNFISISSTTLNEKKLRKKLRHKTNRNFIFMIATPFKLCFKN